MSASVWLVVPAIAAVITAIVSGAGGYMIARYMHSGRIETSAATELWKESRAIRDTLRAQVDGMQEELESAQSRVLELKTQFEQLKTQLVESQEDRRRLRIELQTIRDENEMLRASNKALAIRVNELETKGTKAVQIHTTVEATELTREDK